MVNLNVPASVLFLSRVISSGFGTYLRPIKQLIEMLNKVKHGITVHKLYQCKNLNKNLICRRVNSFFCDVCLVHA